MFGIGVGGDWDMMYNRSNPRRPYVSLAAYFSKGNRLAELAPNQISSEIASYFIANGLQFVYSTIYLLLIYNLTLISMEFDWGKLEKYGGRLRCTIVKGRPFNQSYLFQLPKRILIPTMTYSIIMHWLLGLSMQAEEIIYETPYQSFSKYTATCVPNGLFGSTAMLIIMTIVCWRTFSYRREGFIPQMYGSIRWDKENCSDVPAYRLGL
ncbi:hypothetical protein DBV05_g6648 [Lasiodiplodia theobromae]|uniref:Uncharacterized protein n=1 Tax=Lasiodiplodia theobromae TaxID=45133 RepID=A0A5N5DB88_9PEZI|nr:hypothetical protein DBV05_g6648 [Lasiodiplodia theobromae]